MRPPVPPESPAAVLRVAAIGVDLDGTLVDSAPDIAWSANQTLRQLGLLTLSESAITGMIGDGIETLLQRCLAASLGREATLAELDQARPLMLRCYGDNVFERGTVYPGVVAALARWRDLGKTLACITNKHSSLARPLLERAGLDRYLEGPYCADERALRKPAPALIGQFMDAHQLVGNQVVMIGDSSHDVMAARAAGCAAVAVSYGYGDAAALDSAGPDVTIDRLDQLELL